MTDDRKATHVRRRIDCEHGPRTRRRAYRCRGGDADPARSIRVEVCESGSVGVVTVTGEIDLRTAATLRVALLDAAEAGFRRLVVDFAGVGFCDASGLGALVAANNRLREMHGARAGVRLARVRPAQRRLFQITDLDRQFPAHTTVAEAVRAHLPAAPAKG